MQVAEYSLQHLQEHSAAVAVDPHFPACHHHHILLQLAYIDDFFGLFKLGEPLPPIADVLAPDEANGLRQSKDACELYIFENGECLVAHEIPHIPEFNSGLFVDGVYNWPVFKHPYDIHVILVPLELPLLGEVQVFGQFVGIEAILEIADKEGLVGF
jgi:hypothetical protein